MEMIKRMLKIIAKKLGYLVRRKNPSESRSASLHLVYHPSEQCIFLVLDPADSIQSHHWRGRFYEESEIKIMLKYYESGIFLDIGANVGNHSIYIAKARKDAQIVSFEPQCEAFAVLCANIALNRLTELITPKNFALSDEVKEARIGTPVHNLGQSTLESRVRGKSVLSSFEVCKLTKGDDVVKDRVGFIKIDIEGHELKCLKGLERILEKNHPPTFVEMSDDTYNEVREFLFEKGYNREIALSRLEVSRTSIFILE